MEPTSLPDEAVYTTDQSDDPISTTQPLVRRRFTKAGEDPFDTIEWVRRDAMAGDFFQSDVEVPRDWTNDSIGVVAKLYFATVDGVREDSVRQMVHRVAHKITAEGVVQGHFGRQDRFDVMRISDFEINDSARVFYDELVYVCLHQMAGFNTPTWLNIGVPGRRQTGHACYPLSVQDHMLGEDGIVDWWRKEAMIFKSGGGAGINLSKLRGSMEELSTGGKASGPIPYMRAANAAAETLKSGGAHRRAAKFLCLDADHPDIIGWIDCKPREDKVMLDLMAAGHDLSIFTPDGERNVAEVTSFQSGNISVSASDAFMQAVEEDDLWDLTARTTGEIISTHRARDIMKRVAQAAWQCADPGMIFIDTINRHHTTPSIGPVTTVNTCGEICQNDDTACNLAALNVLKFIKTGEDFGEPDNLGSALDTGDFCHTVDVMMTAMDVVNGFSELPTERITERTRALRQCGLGLTNLGAAIMAQGMPYDSDEARDFGSSVTALLTGRAYAHSATMAKKLGAFDLFEDNRDVMLDVVGRQAVAVEVNRNRVGSRIWLKAYRQWFSAQEMALETGFRNSQVTAMMPTGTVSFLLGADTTGIEPAFSLVTHKQLAAAGKMRIVNQSAHLGAQALGGYSDENLLAMADGDFSCIAREDLPTFATAIGENAIAPMGHLRMVEELQRFTTQAISKTLNVPNSTTVDEIMELYIEAWKRGCKTISVYRDGSKATQVLSAPVKDVVEDEEAYDSLSVEYDEYAAESLAAITGQMSQVQPMPVRRRLPRTRPRTVRHKISVQSSVGLHEGYVSASFYADDTLGEVFLEGFGKMGGFTQNALSAWMTDLSIALQYGVPFDVLVRKHVGHSDETGGIVEPDPGGEPLVIRSCDSIIDYVARWLVAEAGDVDLQEELGVMTAAVKARKTTLLDELNDSVERNSDRITDAVAAAGMSLRMSESIGVLPGGFFDVKLNGNGHARETTISAQPCPACKSPMRRTGTCLSCSCGYSSGGCG